MKKQTIVGLALAMGILSVGAISATAAGSCCDKAAESVVKPCCEKQQGQLSREPAEGFALLKAKEIELRELYLREGIDTQKEADLEAEIKALKSRLHSSVGSCGSFCRG